MSHPESRRGNPERTRELEKLPTRINVQFWFGPHGSGEDVEAMKSVFEKCDIFIPEGLGWNTEVVQAQNDLAQGVWTSEEYKAAEKALEDGIVESRDYHDALMKLIEKSGKFIFYIDASEGFPSKAIPEESELSDPILSSLPRESVSAFMYGKWDEAVSSLRKAFELSAAFHKQREKYMVSDFKAFFTRPESLKKLINAAKLQGKKELNVLIQLGSIHTGVFHELKQLETDPSPDTKTKFQITRSMSPSHRPLFPLIHTNLRSFLFDTNSSTDSKKSSKKFSWLERLENIALKFFSQKEPEKGDELMAQYIIQVLLQMTRSDLNEVTNKFSPEDQDLIFWYLCHSLTLEEIKGVSKKIGERIQSIPQKDRTPKIVTDTSIQEVKQVYVSRGIPFVDTFDGATELLQRAKMQLKRFPGTNLK